MDMCDEYTWFKKNLYEKFNLGVETYRKRFYRILRQPREDFRDFGTRVVKNYERWIEGTNIKKDYAAIRELILIPAYIDALPPTLAVMLSDDAPLNIKTAINLATSYDES